MTTASATAMIRADHGAALALYRKLEPGVADMVRHATLRRLCLTLQIHAQVEEEIFYPALCQFGASAPQLDKSADEHAQMRQGIERVRAAAAYADVEEQMSAVHELMNGVMHHIADEESLLLPMAERVLGAERLSELGARMTRRKRQLARSRAGEIALDSVRGAPAKSGLVLASVMLASIWWWLLSSRPGRHRLRNA